MEQTRFDLEKAGVTLQERGRKSLQMKYKCAPSGACIYVPDKASVRLARTILLKNWDKVIQKEDGQNLEMDLSCDSFQ